MAAEGQTAAWAESLKSKLSCLRKGQGGIFLYHVRKAAGEQAKILNHIMEHWKEIKPEFVRKDLKELLGHTPFQVLMGGLLGVAIGIGGAMLFG